MPKISQDNFKTIEIFKNYIGFANTDIGFAIDTVLIIDILPIISTDSGNTIKLNINNTNNIEEIKIIFKFFKDN